MKTDKQNRTKIQTALIISIIGMLLMFFIAGLFPLELMWGFNHLQYFPGSFITIIAFLSLMILLPDIANRLYVLGQSVSRRFNRLPMPIRIVILVFLAGLIFYLLRVHVHSLGDGYQRVYQVEKGYLHNPPEPLDFFLHTILYMGLNPITGIGAETIYTSLSIIFGIIFVVAIYRFRFPESIDKSTTALSKMLILSFGGLQIFFGYVESYSLLYVATLLFILHAYRYLSNKSGLIYTTIIFGLAISSHQSGFILLPAFIYLLYFNYKAVDPANKMERLKPIILSLIPLLILTGLYIYQRLKYPQYQTGLSDMLLPLYSSGEYSVFSIEHFLDIANEILLIAPIIIMVVPLFAAYGLSKDIEKAHKYFLTLLLIPVFLFIFLFDPKLGMARDWDLFSTPMAVIGMVVVLMAISGKYFDTMSKYSKTILIYGSLVFVSVLIIMNSSESRQLLRAEKLLTISDKNHSYSIELLAHYYWQIIDDKEKALELLYQIEDDDRSARICKKITQLEYKLNNYDKAIKSATMGLEKDDRMVDLYILCGASYKKLNQPVKALELLQQARRLEPTRYNTYSYIGNTYILMDSLNQALAAHKMSIKLNPNDAACYFNVAFVYIEAKEFDSAQVYVNAGLKINPEHPNGGRYLQRIKQGLLELGY